MGLGDLHIRLEDRTVYVIAYGPMFRIVNDSDDLYVSLGTVASAPTEITSNSLLGGAEKIFGELFIHYSYLCGLSIVRIRNSAARQKLEVQCRKISRRHFRLQNIHILLRLVLISRDSDIGSVRAVIDFGETGGPNGTGTRQCLQPF